MLHSKLRSNVGAASPKALTEREAQVLALVAWGKTNKEIGHQLAISVKTVKFHKAGAVKKLHLRSRADIVRYALSRGWLNQSLHPQQSAVPLRRRRT